MSEDPAIVPNFSVKRREDGRWGLYDIDGTCIGSEDSEHLAKCRMEGADTTLSAIMAHGFTDEEQAYMRGQWPLLKRVLYEFGIVPEGEG